MLESPSKNSWARVAFGDVVRLSRERSRDPEGDGFRRYVGLDHLEQGELRIRRWGDLSEGTTFTNVFRDGQVLFGKRRAYQRKVAIADFDGVCSGDIYVFEAKSEHLLPELLPFICQTHGFFEHAVGTSAGSLSPRTNWGSLATYEFGLPPIYEQQRIAAALSAAASLRVQLHRVADDAASVHGALLTSFQASSDFERIKLGSVLRGIVAGKSVVGADTPPADGEYGVVKVSAVDPRGFLAVESKRLLAQEDFLPDHSIRAGDLLITRANTPELVGEVCLVDNDHPHLMLSDKTLRLETTTDIDTYLLWESLQSPGVRQQLASVATGTGRAMKNISQPAIRELVIAYPRTASAAADARKALLAQRTAMRLSQNRLGECVALTRSLREGLLSAGSL